MFKILAFSLVIILLITSCHDPASANDQKKIDQEVQVNSTQSKADFIATLEKHLNAVSNQDAETLKSTLSPSGKMRMMLPGSEIYDSVDSFMKYHIDWFQDTSATWTFETEILHSEIGRDFGTAITQIIYREPERDGKPYFNRMHVSYVLERVNGNWYVIQDHCTSIEKSTDK